MTGGHVIFWYYEMGIEFDLPHRNLSSHVRITPKTVRERLDNYLKFLYFLI
jgi:hypothetical protein